MAADSVYRELQAQIFKTIAEAQTIAAAIRPTLEHIGKATNWAVGHALMRTSDNVLESTGIWFLAKAVHGDHLSRFQRLTELLQFPASKGLPGSVLESGRYAWLTRLQAHETFLRQRAARIAQLHSGFAVPLLVDCSVVGALEFYSRTYQPQDDALLALMHELQTRLGRFISHRQADDAQLVHPQWPRTILEGAGEAFIGMSDSGHITHWNKAAVALFGWQKEEALGCPVSDLIIPPRLRHAHQQGLRRYPHAGEARVLGKNTHLFAIDRSGREFPIQITRWALANAQRTCFYALIDDLTQQKAQETYLREQLARERSREQNPLHDALTGLANRSLLLDRLKGLQIPRLNYWHSFAVLFIDLDDFKNINDRLGCIGGDQALVMFANMLTAISTPADTVARFSSDAFVMLCNNATTNDAATAIARRILNALTVPMHIDTQDVVLSVSIGIVLAGQGDTAIQLINTADTAMSQAKKLGGSRYAVFSRTMRVEATPLWRLETQLKHAIETEQLRLYFQPVVNAANRKISGAEALVRWQHPDKGLLSPDYFLPLAQDTGLIITLSHWLIRKVCQYAQQWQAYNSADMPRHISLNLSAKELEHANIVAAVENAFSEIAFDHTRIRIGMEITENTIMHDPRRIAYKVQQLKDLGIWFALDDFGTGYSSLSHLKDIPLNCIKIDQSFVHNIEHSQTEYSITNTVVTLAHSLGLVVVAEGVETDNQARILNKIGTDFLQGYLYGRAQPAAGFERILWNKNG